MDLSTLGRSIIEKGFPELSDRELILLRRKMDVHGLVDTHTEKEIHIFIDKKLKKADVSAVSGLVAHELCHVILEEKGDWKGRFTDMILYDRNALYTMLVERNVDLEVVLRGFGKELLTFHEYLKKKRYKKEKRKDGLTRKELKMLLGLRK